MIREFFQQANGKLAARPQDVKQMEGSKKEGTEEEAEWTGLGETNKSVWRKYCKRNARRRHRIRREVQARVEYKAIGKEIEQKWKDKNQFVGLQQRANALRESILRGKVDGNDTEDDKSWDQDSSTMDLSVSCKVSVS